MKISFILTIFVFLNLCVLSSEIILNIFVVLVIFNFLFTTVLEYLNDKNWKDNIPDEFKDFYDAESYLKAKNYKISRGKLSSVSSSVSFVFTISMLYFFGFGFFDLGLPLLICSLLLLLLSELRKFRKNGWLSNISYEKNLLFSNNFFV